MTAETFHRTFTAVLCSSAAFLTCGPPVQAQQAAANAPVVEEIVITGTRIKTDITALNPITVISSDAILQSKAVSVEDILNKDPSIDFASGGISQNSNNGGVGASQASIHSLGAARALILLNGQRFPLTDTEGSVASVDLGNIPTSMIERIEVLRNGASSVYGADAVAGVINIITKQTFQGAQVDGMFGVTDKGDGKEHSESATLGMGSDKGNVMINMTYSNKDPVFQRDRAWASDLHLAQFPSGSASSSRSPGLSLSSPPPGYGFKTYYGGHYDSLLVPGTTRFNLSSVPYLQGSLEKKQANLIGHYNISDFVTVVMDTFYTQRNSQELLNPEPIDFATTTQKYPGGFFLPAHSPLNPSNVNINARTRRFEGGPRVYTDDVQTYRLHAGLEGTIWDGYDWHLGYVRGNSQATYRVKGEVNFTHFFQLAGEVPCGADVVYGCHVADGLNGHGNLFSDNGLTPAEVNYFQFINTRTNGYTQDTYYADFSGPVPGITLPGGQAKFAVGLEQRREFSFDNPDSAVVAGDGNSDIAPTKGSYHVFSEYLDVIAPIFKNEAFASSLDLEGSVRHDHYNIYGGATTWKAGLDWAPINDVRFRASRSTAFRAPQVKELFGGAFQNAATATDPCSTGGAAGVGDAARNAACIAALQAAGANGNNFPSSLTQITTINGGNANLKPEKAKEYTFGGVLTPSFLPGFSFGADYYNIDIENYIQALGTQDILESCFLHGVAAACQNIHRQTGSGEITQVLSSNINFGFQKTAGIDFDGSYAFRTGQGFAGEGNLTVDVRSTLELHNYVAGAAGTLNQTGTWAPPTQSIFEPRWRGLLGITYAEDMFSVNIQERYIGAVTLLQGSPGAPGNQAPAIVYSDLAFTYNLDRYKFIIGVNNLTDRDPPFLNDAATNSSTAGYDYVGRFIFFRISAKL